jgi:small subunit ribosomal protein S8
MSMTDPVADLLTRLRNGAHAQKEWVDIPGSGLKKEIARILKEQGYIEAWEVHAPSVESPGETVRIRLKYTEDRKPVISGLRRASRPGRRSYVPHGNIPRVQGGMGTAIVSTSKGVMTGHEARREGVGGEVVAFVW